MALVCITDILFFPSSHAYTRNRNLHELKALLLINEGVCKINGIMIHYAFQVPCRQLFLNLEMFDERLLSAKKDFHLPQCYQNAMKLFQKIYLQREHTIKIRISPIKREIFFFFFLMSINCPHWPTPLVAHNDYNITRYWHESCTSCAFILNGNWNIIIVWLKMCTEVNHWPTGNGPIIIIGYGCFIN